MPLASLKAKNSRLYLGYSYGKCHLVLSKQTSQWKVAVSFSGPIPGRRTIRVSVQM